MAGFELVMSAPNGDDFLSEYAARGVAAPIDIAVTGWVMPKGDGRSLLRRIGEMANPPKVVVYTGELSDMTLRAAVREGATALVPQIGTTRTPSAGNRDGRGRRARFPCSSASSAPGRRPHQAGKGTFSLSRRGGDEQPVG